DDERDVDALTSTHRRDELVRLVEVLQHAVGIGHVPAVFAEVADDATTGPGAQPQHRRDALEGTVVTNRQRRLVGEVEELRVGRGGLTLLMLTPELAGRADLREGCPYGKAEKVHAGVPSGGGGAGAGYGSADRARGRGDRRGCATAGSLGPAGTRAARSASEPGDAFDRPG